MQANHFRSANCLLTLMVLAVIALLPGATLAQEQSDVSRGKAMYTKYCSDCHGVSGKGDGPFAPQLTKKPADLTQLAKKNNGTFPSEQVARFIDGREAVAAHGPREMPIWGERFLEPERSVHKRVQWFVYYLETIQEK